VSATADRRSRGLANAASFLVLTGLSGAGKSQAFKALEDLGYFSVDNLPITLIPMLADLARRAGSDLSKVAIVVDVRERAFLSQFPKALRKLRAMRGVSSSLIFLEASDSALVRRFSETRRPHPLARQRSALEGIREERARLGRIRKIADAIIDTSDLTVHELRQSFMALVHGKGTESPLVVTFVSFGFKHGIPPGADLVFDVRFLPNPHFVPALRARTGRDRRVARYMQQHRVTGQLIDRLVALMRFLFPQYVAEGKSYLTVAIGCTGGRHRSVMIAEALRRQLAGTDGVRLRVRHRDIEQGNELG
jgi:UPF0042 nucleotide-binding protein